MKRKLSDEINDLVIIYRNTGEEKYFNELLEKVKRLVFVIVREYEKSIPNSEMEDIVSEGYLVLCKVVEDYDQYRGQMFSTLLKTYIKHHLNRIYDEATRQKRFNGVAPDSYDRITDICKDGEIEDRTFTVECADFDSVEFSEFLGSIKLTDSERVIVNVIMGGGTKGDCGRVLNIKPASVTYYLKQLRKKFVLAGYAV